MDSARLGQIYNGEYDEDKKQNGRIWLKLTFNKNDQLVMTFVKDKGKNLRELSIKIKFQTCIPFRKRL